ncbi:MAG: hypothetical protein GY789_02655 [Hyphomicrobiales bacterium]|nr:hypothetical protein [Hyphomicrobiales bacterium]
MKHRLTLDYTLGEGELAPYLDGLRRGTATARQCRQCDRVTFPPERMCSCQTGNNRVATFDWKALDGKAEITHRTDGAGGAFALARFAGADNLAVCRIIDPTVRGNQARLHAADGDLPGLAIEILGEAIETAR